jgi:hypothetical protein
MFIQGFSNIHSPPPRRGMAAFEFMEGDAPRHRQPEETMPITGATGSPIAID